MVHVLVLLAAYNGELYIEEQLRSLMTQKFVKLSVLISIDSSTDNTVAICHRWAATYSSITVLENINSSHSACGNFISLLKIARNYKCDFVALCDQDDIWLEDKLWRAISKLKETSSDAYSCNLLAFYPNGYTQVIKKNLPETKLDFLYESASAGNTYVLSRKLYHDLVTLLNNLDCTGFSSHDWLIYAFARSRGYSWLHDDYIGILYRQHSNNVAGANVGVFAFLRRFSYLLNGWYKYDQRFIFKHFGNSTHNFISIFNNLLEIRRNKLSSILISLMRIIGVLR